MHHVRGLLAALHVATLTIMENTTLAEVGSLPRHTATLDDLTLGTKLYVAHWMARTPNAIALAFALPLARQYLELRRNQRIVRVATVAYHHTFGV